MTIDWLLLSEQRGGGGPVDFIWMWGGDYACRALVSAGAAASHAEILRYVVQELPSSDVAIVGPQVPHEALMSPRDPGYAHTFGASRSRTVTWRTLSYTTGCSSGT